MPYVHCMIMVRRHVSVREDFGEAVGWRGGRLLVLLKLPLVPGNVMMGASEVGE